MFRPLRILLFICFGFASLAAADERNTGPWNLAELKKPPEAKWSEPTLGVQEVYFAGEPLEGKPTRVFAYFAKPDGAGPFPAMVLVHGGGGKAFKDWAIHWQKRGYAAISMDLAGNGPDGRLADGAPDQSDDVKFKAFDDASAKNMWTYHAVADVVRAHSLIAAREEVDAKRIGITGISWGGYLTNIVAGIDDRFKVAVPVYGCGFLDDNSAWTDRIRAMPAEQRERWTRYWDPAKYVGGVRCPMLYLNGTNDFAYPLDSYKKTYSLVNNNKDVKKEGPVTLSIVPRLPHGHIWTFRVVDDFVDSVLRNGPPLAKLSAMRVADGMATCTVDKSEKLARPELHYTTDQGPWQKREWKSVPGELSGNKLTAKIPEGRPIVVYLSVQNENEVMISTQHEEIKE